LLLAVPLYYGLYYWSRSHTVPIVTMTLMGGALFPLLPATAAWVAWLSILFAGGLALFALLWAVIR